METSHSVREVSYHNSSVKVCDEQQLFTSSKRLSTNYVCRGSKKCQNNWKKLTSNRKSVMPSNSAAISGVNHLGRVALWAERQMRSSLILFITPAVMLVMWYSVASSWRSLSCCLKKVFTLSETIISSDLCERRGHGAIAKRASLS